MKLIASSVLFQQTAQQRTSRSVFSFFVCARGRNYSGRFFLCLPATAALTHHQSTPSNEIGDSIYLALCFKKYYTYLFVHSLRHKM